MNIHAEDPIIEVHDLTVSYSQKPVLWGIDLSLPKGSLVGIVGPNGAGKSTLIKAIMDLVPLSSGYVKLFDTQLDNVREKISYVPQRESVDWDFPASVYDVVMMGRYGKLGLFKRPRQADREVVQESMRLVGMEAFKNRQISQLSGGQQQRVFLARALAQQAEVYFMDEPFAGVDAATEKAIVELLRRMSKEGKTVVVVHHDLQSVAKYFDWLILLNMRLVASGPTVDVFKEELLQEAYGGKLTILSEVGDLLTKGRFPSREKTV
ncbi:MULTISPECIES: metal ABC transporter ATP-binding protein [unclassified Imperialibacter]|uniref:metal ABC transporter ATP-binding protein n=1 Tax=unclassified Imperialibacter TaxID=2629706 RepID=UPI0012566900|nr:MULTISPECIES: metal ABC transporter ATP-binding protein [unclassified Imperialibacter]CAD5258160.1 Manganese transport system ATP-binding protein MntB [Imperialibacter sp. 75]CAD5261222.1 Manganese transport system ATP-binding protein MntB [Imperialibacter sp. 89]VVT24958.1 Manganese transport system ATP-binding protein MntB [Imperialibacter sp. EC-SDR9]